MKTIIWIMVIPLLSSCVNAQNSEIDNRRYISVTGSAEVIVQPDEIELEIVLKEYIKSNNRKSNLAEIESKFLKMLKKNNISEEQLVFGSSDYYWYYWWTYRNDMYKQKTYKVRLDSTTDFLSLVKDLDNNGVKSLRISDTSNKELQKLRKEVKISALVAAKEKATYLLESIDEKVGKIISVEELINNNYYWRNNQNALSNVVVSSSSNNNEVANVARIKLRYEVKAKFEIE